MADDYQEASDDVEMAAAELVARVKAEELPNIEVPIVEDSNVWEVKVKKLRISPEGDWPDGGE
jgi:hypothetical protein